jgi:hypothetical protein
VAFVVLVISVIVVVVVLVIDLVTAPVDGSNEFLDHLRDRDYQGASAQLCAASPYEPARTLALKLEPDGRIDSFDLDRSTISNDSGSVGGTITIGGVHHRIVIELTKDNGAWKVCDAALDVAFPSTSGAGN